NDLDLKRCYVLLHNALRVKSPLCVVTNNDASEYPDINIPTSDGSTSLLRFDRILCDVPCSGDGTIRKSPDVWWRWSPQHAFSLHKIQLKILLRACRMLKVGGRVVYSTCSMNVVENEAVVAACLRATKGRMRVVDASGTLPDLKRAKGLTDWDLMLTFDKNDLDKAEESDASQEKKKGKKWKNRGKDRLRHKHKLRDAGELTSFWMSGPSDVPERFESLVPPSVWSEKTMMKTKGEGEKECEYEDGLEHCMRIYPHLQNTGGFFVCVLEKVEELEDGVGEVSDEMKKKRQSIAIEVLESDKKKREKQLRREEYEETHEEGHEEGEEEKETDMVKRAQKMKKKKISHRERLNLWAEEPLYPMPADSSNFSVCIEDFGIVLGDEVRSDVVGKRRTHPSSPSKSSEGTLESHKLPLPLCMTRADHTKAVYVAPKVRDVLCGSLTGLTGTSQASLNESYGESSMQLQCKAQQRALRIINAGVIILRKQGGKWRICQEGLSFSLPFFSEGAKKHNVLKATLSETTFKRMLSKGIDKLSASEQSITYTELYDTDLPLVREILEDISGINWEEEMSKKKAWEEEEKAKDEKKDKGYHLKREKGSIVIVRVEPSCPESFTAVGLDIVCWAGISSLALHVKKDDRAALMAMLGDKLVNMHEIRCEVKRQSELKKLEEKKEEEEK
ncbi:RNA (C5-cytosine) methyltransferase like protein, partial [Aduncisulcus paluster]